jgi:hypothetical protein
MATPPGWDEIVADTHAALLLIDPGYEIHQIKSKFGALRFYSTLDGNPTARSVVRAAEEASYVTCSECGIEDGTVTTHDEWNAIRLCVNCYADSI